MPRFTLGQWAARLFVSSVVVAGVAASAVAQLPQVRLQSLFPAGVKAGESIELTLNAGTDLDELDAMVFNHPGIQAKKKDGTPNVFVITSAGDVPPGVYEARVHGLYGIGNPRPFAVGLLKESNEVELNNTKEQATAVEIGSVINAQSAGGADIDFYKFTGKKGQLVTINVYAPPAY